MSRKMSVNLIKAFAAACVAWLAVIVYNSYVTLNGDWRQILVGTDWITGRKLLFLAFLFTAAFLFAWDAKRVLDWLFRYRFAIAGAVFVICVAAGLTGSSIGNYCSWFNTEDTGILLGVSRPIRTDEWAVSTPMAWSQYYGEEPFSYFSTLVRGTETDVFLEYGQAAADWMIIFRPFYIGYLFLPVANGMAFFWCGRFLALFLVSFEFGRILTKDKRSLALVYAVLLAFAPVVQWWFAVNGLVEMLIYIQLAILILRAFMLTASFPKRVGLVLAAVLCAGGYILTFYPAWQVPLAYVLLALAVWTVMEYKDRCVMHARDWLAIAGGIVLLALAMLCILYQSRDTIEALLNTVYPGKRSATGGGQLCYLFNYVFSVWLTVTGGSPLLNPCECAYFMDLFPLCYVAAAVPLFKQKRKDRLLLCILIAAVFLGIYCIVGFPEFLAKITLLNYSTGGRSLIAFGFCNVILLIRGMASIREIRIPFRVTKSAVLLALALLAVYGGYRLNPQWFSKAKLLAMFAAFGALFVCSIYVNKKACFRVWSGIIVCAALLAGGWVNPVRMGVEDIEEIPELQAVKSIVAEDEDALWVVEGMDFERQNALLLVGAPTVNSTNVYPAMERWTALDGGENADIYNRYAHITINIIEEGEPEFELTNLDAFTVSLTLEDLKEMNVKYIFTERKLTGEAELVEKVNDYYIYRLK